jgi:hypothetical protein
MLIIIGLPVIAASIYGDNIWSLLIASCAVWLGFYLLGRIPAKPGANKKTGPKMMFPAPKENRIR